MNPRVMGYGANSTNQRGAIGYRGEPRREGKSVSQMTSGGTANLSPQAFEHEGVQPTARGGATARTKASSIGTSK